MGRGLFKRLALVLISAGYPVCPLLLSLGVASEAPRTKLGAGLSAEAARDASRDGKVWPGGNP